MRPRGSYIGYFIGLRFECLLLGRHLLSVSPTVLLLVTNIAQFLHHHHHLLSLPSVNHCLSADTLITTTESHQKRDQSEFNKQNQLCLAAPAAPMLLLLADWELLKLKMWKWTVFNWNWRWGYLEGKVEGRSIIKISIREMILRTGPSLPPNLYYLNCHSATLAWDRLRNNPGEKGA